jgi:serine/threonine protein kinase
VKWIMELVSALEYLHKGLWWVVYFLSLNILFIDNFVHRDIKPQYA